MSVEVFHATPPARPYRFELLPDDAMASALELLEQPLTDGVSEELDRAVARGLGSALAFAGAQTAEQQAARALLLELSALPPDEMERRLAEQRPRFRSGELCELLWAKCAEEVHHDPARALHFSRLALAAAGQLDETRLPRAIRQDIWAETWAAVADTHRLAGETTQAEAALARAESHLGAGSGTLMVRAGLLLRKASLAADLGRTGRGMQAVDQALCVLRAGARREEIARAVLVKGRLDLADGRAASALALFEEAVALADGSRDWPLWLAAQQNLAACLCELGRFADARRPLATAADAVRRLGRPLGRLDLCWLEGLRAAGDGDFATAEAAFSEAARGFRARRKTVEAAQVSLDLGRLYVRRRRIGRLHRVIRPLLPYLWPGGDTRRRRRLTDRSW